MTIKYKNKLQSIPVVKGIQNEGQNLNCKYFSYILAQNLATDVREEIQLLILS